MDDGFQFMAIQFQFNAMSMGENEMDFETSPSYLKCSWNHLQQQDTTTKIMDI